MAGGCTNTPLLMSENNQHIIGLLEKYHSGQASSGEVDQLLALLQAGDYDEAVISFITSGLETFEPGDAGDIAFWKSRLAGGARQITGAVVLETDSNVPDLPADRPVHRVHFSRRWGWAAAVILLLGTGAVLWTRSTKKGTPSTTDVARNTHIAPGKKGAILTLADGSQVVLDSVGNGLVATQNGARVVLKGGGLSYDPTGADAKTEVMYNIITTPKGRQFQVTLPDGTRVWLNAGSSLRYTTVFTGQERRVLVTGEAYFEVARNTQAPFKVSVNGKAEIEVLGTHFNVNAYDNESAIHTTLLQGSIRVATVADKAAQAPAFVVLKPGQQARIQDQAVGSASPSVIKVINHADTNKVMAWKNGLFNFEGASLAEVLRQIERWYDIDIIYEKGIPAITFEGKMTKDVPLKDLLVMLERSDIHFRIDGRRLIVLP